MDSRSISQKKLILTDRLTYRFFLAFLNRIVVGRLLSLAWNNRLIFPSVNPRLAPPRKDPLSDHQADSANRVSAFVQKTSHLGHLHQLLKVHHDTVDDVA